MPPALRRACLLGLLLAAGAAGASGDAADGGACAGPQPDAPRWFDRAQGFFSQRACNRAVWFDRFFGDTREDDVASSLVQLIPEARYSDRERFQHGVRLKARFNLPNLDERLSLVFSDEPAGDETLLPGEQDRESGDSVFGQRSSAALRYLVRAAGNSKTDVDVGIRSEIKGFVRARYMKTWALSPQVQTRFTQTVMFEDGPGWGETSLGEIERLLGPRHLLRFGSQLSLEEEIDGLRWRQGVQLLHQVDRDRALIYGGSVLLGDEPHWRDLSYRLGVRYRERLFRPWFFVEFEPYMDWTRSNDFNSNPGIVLRAEVWFGDTGRSKGMPSVRAPHRETLPPDADPGTEPPADLTPVEIAPWPATAPPAEVTTPTNDVPTDE